MTESGPSAPDDLTTPQGVSPAVPPPAAPVPPPEAPAALPPGGYAAAGAGVPGPRPGIQPGAQRAVAGALLALIGVAAGVIITLLIVKGDSGGSAAEATHPTSAAAPAASPGAPSPQGDLVEPRNTSGGAILVGDPAARVQLRVYEDYLCPYCAQFEKENGAQLEQWTASGDVSVDFRMLSILDRATSTAYSTRAAMASAAVRDLAPQKWLAFHSSLFASQPAEGGAGLTDETLADLAGQAGAPEDGVLEALTSRRYAAWVGAVSQNAAAGQDKVEGTPTVILIDTKTRKGYLVQDWSAKSLKKAVDDLVGQASS